MRHEPGWVCPLKSWGRGWPRTLASVALGAQRSSLWAGEEQVQFQGWTSLFHPLGGESLSSFDLGSRGPAVSQAPSQVSQLPDDSRDQSRWLLVLSQVSGFATFLAHAGCPGPLAVGPLSMVATRTPLVQPGGVGPDCCRDSAREGGWGLGSWGAGSLPWEPGLGLWLQLMDWDGRSWQGRSLGGEGGELSLEVRGWGRGLCSLASQVGHIKAWEK